jgi:hypothetical protein
MHRGHGAERFQDHGWTRVGEDRGGEGSGGSEKEAREEKEVGARRPRLTERDLEAIRWLVEQRAATIAQVGRLLAQISRAAISDRRTRQVVARWIQLGLVERRQVWHHEPAIVMPTTQAAKMCGIDRWRPVAIGILRHTLTASEVRLIAAPVGGSRTWIPESHLRRGATRHEHVADGGWTEPDGSSVAVEVELSQHGKKRVHAAIRALLSAYVEGTPRWTSVLYLCSPSTIRQVEMVRNELSPSDQPRVAVHPVPSLTRLTSQGSRP